MSEKDIDILNKKFNGEKNGYSPKEVDAFLDELINERNSKNSVIESLYSQILGLKDELKTTNAALYNLKNEFSVFKMKYKNIKETDIISNDQTLNIKKINAYEKFLYDHGFDPKDIEI